MKKSEYEKIINYFNISKVNDKLSNEFKMGNNIQNSYGRNLYSNTSLLNHFIQSSAALPNQLILTCSIPVIFLELPKS